MKTLKIKRIQALFLIGSLGVGMSAQDYILNDLHVSDFTGYNFKQASLSVSQEGGMAIAWENVGGNGIWMKTLSVEQDSLSEIVRVTAPFSHDRTWIMHNDNGQFMLMYGGFGVGWDLYAQLYGPDGSAIGDTINISGDYDGFVDWINASLHLNDLNEYVIMYPVYDSLIVERVSETGEFVGRSMALKPDMSGIYGLKGVSFRDGESLLSWTALGGNIYVRLYDVNGEPVGTSIQVSELEPGHSVNDHKIKCDTSGNFVVVWEETFEGEKAIYAQLFNSEGAKIGNKEAIVDPEGVYSGQMSLDMDLDGEYVVAWTDGHRGDTTFIYIQQMSSAGVPVGNNYKATSVNDSPASEGLLTTQTGSAVLLLNDTIYLVWENVNPNTFYTSEIYANILQWKIPEATNISFIQDQEGISIYPNPSRGTLTVELDNESTANLQLVIYNSRGMMVRQDIVQPGVSQVNLDLTLEPPGLYFLRLNGPHSGYAAPLILVDE